MSVQELTTSLPKILVCMECGINHHHNDCPFDFFNVNLTVFSDN